MAEYQLTVGNTFFRRSDKTYYPMVEEHPVYLEFQAWLAVPGNVPDPPDTGPVKFGDSKLVPEARVQTVGTTPAEVLRQSVPANTGYRAHLTLTALADDLSFRTIDAIVVVGRGAGPVAIIQNAAGQNQSVVADHRSNATAASWTITPSVDNTAPGGVQRRDYIITVAGSAGRTVNWRLTGKVEITTPGGMA